MDQVLKEERAKLSEIEGVIEAAAEKCKKAQDDLSKEISGYITVDYEDIGRKKGLIDQRKKAAADYAGYVELIPSPYFGRLDLDREVGDNYELSSYYIGKKGLTIGAIQYIVDWRAPVGECYYAQNQTTFDVKGLTYSLALRRALNIQNAELINYKTEYDGNTVSLEGDVIDPFLLTVLKDKRRQNRLTDIIRSIQANQNDIIRRPLQESFIVQGCAGSGKTMILLHRLSYLKFNNRSMSLSRVKIITPNPDFNAHINELSTELDIDTIQKFTVEEYYVDLINRYARNPNIVSAVESESTLKPDLLGEIYSVEFMQSLQEQYHSFWETVLASIDEKRLMSYFKTHGINYPATSSHAALAASALNDGITSIVRDIKERIEKYNEAQRRKAALEDEYKKAEELCSKVEEEATHIRGKMVETARADLAVVSDKIAQINNYTQPSRTRLQELADQDGGTSDEFRRLEKELALIRRNYDSYTDYDSLESVQDEIGSSLISACAVQISRVRDIDEQLRKTPAYSFVKRNSLRRQLQEAKTSFSEAARKHLDSMIAKKEKEQSALNSSAQAHRDEIMELSQTVEAADREIAQLKRKQKALDECIAELVASGGMNQRIVLSVGARNEMVDFLADYEKITSNLEKQSKHMADIQKRMTLLEEQALPPYDEDMNYLETCQTEVTKLKASEVYRQVMRKALLTAYTKHGEEYTRKNYRHKLFLMLLFCSLYYNRLVNSDTYLNIDEAQDISTAEYILLRKILGENCIFNLYGDINQALFPEKSIMDWEDLKNTIGENVYILNENYRNTLQITEYCNDEFSAEIYPIGIKGAPVAEKDAASAVKWLIEIKRSNPEYRTAIVVHGKDDATKERLAELLGKTNVSWFAVDDKKISVLTVENAKGLEFEAVAVLSADMEINEQYIAYTRALDHLCVAKQAS